MVQVGYAVLGCEVQELQLQARSQRLAQGGPRAQQQLARDGTTGGCQGSSGAMPLDTVAVRQQLQLQVLAHRPAGYVTSSPVARTPLRVEARAL